MSIDALRMVAQTLSNDPQAVGIMFFILKDCNGFTCRNVELSADAQASLTNEIKLELKEFFETDYVLRDLTSVDLRLDTLFRYNLPTYPDQLSVFKSTLDDTASIPAFDHVFDDLADLKAIVVLLGNGSDTLSIYKHHYPTNTYRRNGFSIFRAGINQDRFEKLQQDIVRMSHSIDFIYSGSDVFVANFKVLEKFFGFKEAVKADASSKLAILSARNLVEDVAVLQDRIVAKGDVTFARKVIRAISHSRVLSTVSNDRIIQFIKQHHSLSKKIKVNAADTLIILDTEISQNFFMKLLNDDYLRSELTQFEYDADSKDLVEQIP